MSKPATFKTVLKGYDKATVDAYIATLQQELSNKNLLIETYDKRMKELYQEVNNLKQAIIMAKAKLLKTNQSQLVLTEANQIIAAAQHNADEIIGEALASAKILLIEIARLNQELGLAKEEVQSKLLKIEALMASIQINEPPNIAWLKEI